MSVAQRAEVMGTIPQSIVQNEGTFSVPLGTAESRAQFLWSLKQHVANFTAAEHDAYNALRDECIRFARGGGSTEALNAYAALFKDRLTPVSAKEEPPLVQTPLVSPIQLHETEIVQSAAPSKVHTGRRGPDIRVPDVVSTPTEVAQSPIAAVMEQLVVKDESPKKEVEPVPSVPAPEAIVEVSSLRERVHQINEDLNTFADGKAFQWLSDTATGYREYMNALISLRSDLNASDVPTATIKLLEDRVNDLETLAQGVRSFVGGTQASDSGTPKAPETVVAPPEPALELTDTPPVESVAAIEPSAQPMPVEVSPVKITISHGDGPGPVQDIASAVAEMSTPSGEEHHHASLVMPRDEASVPPTIAQAPDVYEAPLAVERTEETLPAPEIFIEPRVHANVASDIYTGGETQPVVEEVPKAEVAPSFVTPVTEAVPTVERSYEPVKPEIDTLATPAIDAGLHALLTKWLGTTGFLGFGDSGEKHPDWLVMRGLYIDDIKSDDGVVPKGLRPDTLDNLRANVKAWSDKYGLFAEGPAETVEHFLRRVVSASSAP